MGFDASAIASAASSSGQGMNYLGMINSGMDTLTQGLSDMDIFGDKAKANRKPIPMANIPATPDMS